MKKCKQGYYYCYTDKVCKPLSKGMRVMARFSGNGKEPEETGIDVPLNGNGTETDGGNGDGGGTVSEEGLRDWFGKSKSKDGKKGWVNVVTGGTCASDKPGEGTPKCVSSAKRASMTKAERLSAQRRKKKADPGQQQKSGAAKPTYVSTDPKKKMKKEEVEVTEAKDKKGKGSGSKDACYHKVKSRYSVWPSAYASGALVKCRKVGAANWGNSTKKEEVEQLDELSTQKLKSYRKKALKDADKKHKQAQKHLSSYFNARDAGKNDEAKKQHAMAGKNIDKVDKRKVGAMKADKLTKEGYAPGDVDQKVGAANWGNKSESVEFSNWRDEFKAMDYEFTDIIKPEPIKGGVIEEGSFSIDPKAHRQAQKQQKIRNMTQSPNENEAKVAKKKAKGPDLMGEEQIDEAGKKCWKGYKKKGTQTLFGKTYNRCVKADEGYAPGDVDQKVGAVTAIPKKDQDAAKARLLAKAKAKREKMGEDFEKEVPSGDIKKLVKKAVKRIDQNVSGHVDNKDKSMGEYGEFVPSPDGKSKIVTSVKKESISNWRKEIEEGAAWTKKSGKSESGGLNEKGRKSYERENPGSDLKAPSKKVGNPRRKSFCARMKGMKKKLTSSKTANDPDSRINKSLRAWNC